MAWSLSFSKAKAVLGLVLTCVAPACAAGGSDDGTGGAETESDALVAPSVIVADPAATRAADVRDDRVVLPLASADRYRALGASAIFVGARGPSGSKNPDGFLRRVSSAAVEGDTLVIMTTPATLTDAIVHGAVRTSSGGLSIDDHGGGTQSLTGLQPLTRKELRGVAIDFADEPLFDGEDAIEVGAKKARFVESIRLERAVLTAKPVVDVDLRIRDGKVSKLVAKVEGSLDTSVLAIATVTGEGDLDEETLAALFARKHDVKRVVYESPRVALPTIAVGGVPISPAVQFTVTLKCTLAFGGLLRAHAGVEAKSQLRLGGVYENGAWGAPIRSEFEIVPSFTVDRGGKVEARCAMEVDAELFAYGTSGVIMSVAPYVDFSVKPEATGYRHRVGAGAVGVMRGREGAVFGLPSSEFNRSLVEWKAPALLEGVSP